MKHTLSILALVAAAPVLAEDTRQLDAHEHGVGTLNIAIQGADVAMTFEAPGADIVGFEYVAKRDADLAAIKAALGILNAPLEVFVMPDAAGCSVVTAKAALESEDGHEDGHGDHDDHGHGDTHKHGDEGHTDKDHAEHAHDGTHKHGDEGHTDKDHAEHAHDEEHKHGDEAHAEHSGDAGHTEFHAEYALSCTNPEALSQITFAYFDTFANAQEVEVQVLSASGAQAFEVTRDAPVLTLGR